MAEVMSPRQENGHYAVDHLGRQYHPAGNFDFGAHDRYVERDGCPVVSQAKTWCGLRQHATGPPGSPSIRAGGRRGWENWD